MSDVSVLAFVGGSWRECMADVSSRAVHLRDVSGAVIGEFDCLRIERVAPVSLVWITFGGSTVMTLVDEATRGESVKVRQRRALSRSLGVHLRKAGWKIFLPPDMTSAQVQEFRPAHVRKAYSF